MNSASSKNENWDQFYKGQSLRRLSVETGYSSASGSAVVEDTVNSSTYQNFLKIVNAIFDSVADIDLLDEVDDHTELSEESLIQPDKLQILCNETAKLKLLNIMNQFPPEHLIRLLTILARTIIDGSKLFPLQMPDEQIMMRILRSADASLTALYIMTSPNTQPKLFIEDVIEKIVLFVKYQLQNTIFPEFDRAYAFDLKTDDGNLVNIRQKGSRANKVTRKSTLHLYNKIQEAVSLLCELLEFQTLTDSIILEVSTLGVGPFFVEGIEELQLNALRLITTVFAHYEKHRSLILEDIFSSISRLPTSKNSIRNYRLSSENGIQMLTALILQLMHSVIRFPEPKDDSADIIITSYEASMKTVLEFLSVFLKKCGVKNEEIDYKLIFENFILDVLNTYNNLEWPASELLLSILARILVKNFMNKSKETSLRATSLDYLGIIAARSRKDNIANMDNENAIGDIIQRICGECNDTDLGSRQSRDKPVKHYEVIVLQKVFLQYLNLNFRHNPDLRFSRMFYIAQWYRDAVIEIEGLKESSKSLSKNYENHDVIQAKEQKQSHSNNKLSSHSCCKETQENISGMSNLEYTDDIGNVASAEERKRFVLAAIKCSDSLSDFVKHDPIDYETAMLISRYLASARQFSRSFDYYLLYILRMLSETAVALRSKAMKCLSLIVETDPSILARPDVQKAVQGRLLDHSTCVREATVDLLGKFILICPEILNHYYQMLTERILDTGVSVRKRVIRILRNICLEHPDFSKIPEIYVKVIRRVNDEDGIRKLVHEFFQSMLLNPVSETKPYRILQKVKNIMHVVETCQDNGIESFEELFLSLLKGIENATYNSAKQSCKQIIDCLVENLLKQEEYDVYNINDGVSSQLVTCLATLHLFSKIFPQFVVSHATTIQPYLSMKCDTQLEVLLLKNVAHTLELLIPLIEHPSESFLVQIEENLVKLVLCQHMGLLPNCVSCFGTVVNKITHNYQLAKECFQKFLSVILVYKVRYETNPRNPILETMRPKLLRSLYIIGLFCCNFQFSDIDIGTEENEQISFKDKVFGGVLYFNFHPDEDVKVKALTSLGFIMAKHYEFMLFPEIKTLYQSLLTSPVTSPVLKCQVLKNITNYLIEEDMLMVKKDAEWNKTSKSENLKEMCDVTSGMASTIIQIYLKPILLSVLHSAISVRKLTLSVIQLIFAQGLVHPVHSVKYLVCLGSDDDPAIRIKSYRLLQDIEKKYPGIIKMEAVSGIRLSFKMQQLIQEPDGFLRGFRCFENPVSRNGLLYSVMRSTRHNRRAFLKMLLKLFEEAAKTPLMELLYIADNIVYFPYVLQDESLFIIHELDIGLSVTGINLLQKFRESLSSNQLFKSRGFDSVQIGASDSEDDDDDFESILERLPEDLTVLQECVIAFQNCILMLCIKQTLKKMYGLSDNKINLYSPNESSKVYERPHNRRNYIRFNPETVLSFIKAKEFEANSDEKNKTSIVKQYCHFRQLLFSVDSSEVHDEDDNHSKSVKSISTVSSLRNTSIVSSLWSNSAVSSLRSNSTVSSLRSNSTVSSLRSNSTVSSLRSNSTVSSLRSNSTVSYVQNNTSAVSSHLNSTTLCSVSENEEDNLTCFFSTRENLRVSRKRKSSSYSQPWTMSPKFAKADHKKKC